MSRTLQGLRKRLGWEAEEVEMATAREAEEAVIEEDADEGSREEGTRVSPSTIGDTMIVEEENNDDDEVNQ
ncbi:uncharacterized protein HKW66_Vig0240980 [Vigna angularis]|uniref:Uncharacterized protein n=1 Tax=Phaseolus angularis TaxID=3914 RepID=A0A8T0JGX2_PHAAN|nr:uncharacterized protein HKW66_Vig0240980 [Vigna angularis]